MGAESPTVPGPPRGRFTLLAVSTLTVMAGATIAPGLPAMRHHFAAVDQAGLLVRLVLTLPALLIALAAPLVGGLVDRLGRRPPLLGALLLYGLAGSSGLVLDSLEAILVGRALLGVAVAAIMTTATTLVADYMAGEKRARFMGWQASAMAGGGMVYLLAGGLLADLSWRLPFALYLVALLLLPLAWWRLPEPASGTGAAVAQEPEPQAPVPYRLLAVVYALALFGLVSFYMVPVQLPFLLEEALGLGPSASGLAISVSTLVSALVSLVYGRVRARLSATAVAALVFFFIGAGYLVIGGASSLAQVMVGLAVGGCGPGLMLPNFNLWLTTEVPEAARGRALGGLTTAVFLGQFLSPVVAQPAARALGLSGSFTAVGLVLAVLAPALALALPRVLGGGRRQRAASR
jgi:MFS family permease